MNAPSVNMNTMKTLLQREFLEGKFFYFWLPVILLGIITAFLLLGLFGLGPTIMAGDGDLKIVSTALFVDTLRDLVAEKPDQAPYAITFLYQGLSALAWISVPFVVFFSLVGSLYDERRDRSILFWKSMPVSDLEEVLAKLLTAAFVVPLMILAVTIVWQIGIAVLISAFVGVYSGPVLVMWPLLTLVDAWIAAALLIMLYGLWALPVLCWLLLASAYAPRVPFVYATLPIAVVMGLEAWMYDSTLLASWLGDSLGGGFIHSLDVHGEVHDPRDVFEKVNITTALTGFGNSLISARFWAGLLVAAALIFGTVQLRRRAQ